MTEPYWWYILFVRAGKETKVINDFMLVAESRKIPFEIDIFCLQSEVYFRGKQRQTSGEKYKKKPVMPGYIFVETNMPARDFLGEFSEYIRNSSEIIRILNSGEVDNIALPDAERKRFEYLFLGKRSLDHSVGYIEGERIVITMGPLKGREGLIKHINRHNRMAIIELSVFEQSLCVKIALEIIEKN